MLIRQKIIAVMVSVSIFISIIYLVREKKLKEEYSWLWLLTALAIMTLALRYDLLLTMTRLVGAVVPISTLFFFGLIFLMVISISYSVRISTLSLQVKNLAQKLTILEGYVRDEPYQQGKASKHG